MRRNVLLATSLVVALVALAVGAYAAAGGGKHTVKSDPLTGYQEPPAISSPGSGSFKAEIHDDTTPPSITYELRYSGLTTPALFSHIHFGNRFTVGGVAAFLCGGGGKPACPAGTTSEAVVTGTITPADVIGPTGQGIAPGEFAELIQAIRAGLTYTNVHTPTWPGGEIRGQINDENRQQD